MSDAIITVEKLGKKYPSGLDGHFGQEPLACRTNGQEVDSSLSKPEAVGRVWMRPANHLCLWDQGIVVLTSGSPQVQQAGLHRAVCHIPGNPLNSGGYYLKLLVVENGNEVTYTNESIASFTVVDVAERKGSWMGREPSVIRPRFNWFVEK